MIYGYIRKSIGQWSSKIVRWYFVYRQKHSPLIQSCFLFLSIQNIVSVVNIVKNVFYGRLFSLTMSQHNWNNLSCYCFLPIIQDKNCFTSQLVLPYVIQHILFLSLFSSSCLFVMCFFITLNCNLILNWKTFFTNAIGAFLFLLT
jgi:hypothetical protein